MHPLRQTDNDNDNATLKTNERGLSRSTLNPHDQVKTRNYREDISLYMRVGP